MLAITILVILVGAGLAVDVGYMERQKQRMQVAADAAAVAGASALITNAESPASAGDNDATLNGFTTAAGTTITINNPPKSGAFTSNDSYVEAIIDQPQPTWFLSLLGIKTMDVSARAVAGTANANGCMYVLDPSASGAITANGNGNITSQCGILDDSSSSTALIANGNVTITASAIGVVGKTLANGNVVLTPKPITGILPVSDPLAGVPAPFVGPCTYNNFIVNSNQSVQMSPGVYCGGIIFNGNTKANFAPGVYVLAGGGMLANGGCTLTGTGRHLLQHHRQQRLRADYAQWHCYRDAQRADLGTAQRNPVLPGSFGDQRRREHHQWRRHGELHRCAVFSDYRPHLQRRQQRRLFDYRRQGPDGERQHHDERQLFVAGRRLADPKCDAG